VLNQLQQSGNFKHVSGHRRRRRRRRRGRKRRSRSMSSRSRSRRSSSSRNWSPYQGASCTQPALAG